MHIFKHTATTNSCQSTDQILNFFCISRSFTPWITVYKHLSSPHLPLQVLASLSPLLQTISSCISFHLPCSAPGSSVLTQHYVYAELWRHGEGLSWLQRTLYIHSVNVRAKNCFLGCQCVLTFKRTSYAWTHSWRSAFWGFYSDRLHLSTAPFLEISMN